MLLSYPKKDAIRPAARVVAVYALAGLAWIFLSDTVLAFFFTTETGLVRMQTYKGSAFVLTTAAILFLVLRREWGVRLQKEEQIRQQAELLNITQDAVVVRKWDGRILFWNKGAERLYGWTRDEAIGRLSQELLYNSEMNGQRGVSQEVLLKEGAWRGERQQKSRDGCDLTVDAHLTLVRDEKGDPDSVLCINTDITDKKVLEGQLRQAQKVESVGALAGGIVHDFNNLLAIISGFTELSLKSLPASRTEERRMLENVLVASRRATALVGRILAFLRHKDPVQRKIDLPEEVEEVAKLLRETLPANIRVETRVEDGMPGVVGDPDQIQQVLLNLCVNARDAMPEGGALSLIIRQAYSNEFLPLANGDYVCIEVKDTGAGIPEHLQERLFEPFVTSKSQGKGTGLGLSMVLGIVRSHGGSITYRSQPGGTTFFVYLPLQEKNESGDEVEGFEPGFIKEGQGELVVVAEDEPALLELTMRCLQNNGYSARAARSGPEVRELLEELSSGVSAMIVNYQLPGLSGVQIIAEVKKVSPDAPVLIATGYIEEAERERLHRSGAAAILTKPYGAIEVITELSNALRENPAAHSH